jgi:hypothetical protein
MQVFTDQNQNIYTDIDYSPAAEDLTLSIVETDKEKFHVDAEDFVASVPGSMTLEELDQNLKDFKMISNIQAPAKYSISKILAEFHDVNLLKKVLGLNLNHLEGFETLAGGKVIKNVSGYDMKKLYIGSFNSLALITNAFIKLEKRFDKELIIRFKIKKNYDDLFKIRNFIQSFLDDRIVCKVNYNKDLDDFSVLVKTSASEKILEYRRKSLLDFLKKEVQVNSLPQIEKKDFKPDYKEAQRIEFRCKFSNLKDIFAISKEDITVEPLLGIASITEFQDLTALLPLIYDLKVFPVTFFSRKILKDLAANTFEDELLVKLKSLYDKKQKLNPGVL